MAFLTGSKFLQNQGVIFTNNEDKALALLAQSPQQLNPFALRAQERTILEDIARLPEGFKKSADLRLNEEPISNEAIFVTRSSEQVMKPSNVEAFVRSGGVVVDGNKVFFDSLLQGQVKADSVKNAARRVLLEGFPNVKFVGLQNSRTVSSTELLQSRFRLPRL